MNTSARQLIRTLTILVVAALSFTLVHAASADTGSVGLWSHSSYANRIAKLSRLQQAAAFGGPGAEVDALGLSKQEKQYVLGIASMTSAQQAAAFGRSRLPSTSPTQTKSSIVGEVGLPSAQSPQAVQTAGWGAYDGVPGESPQAVQTAGWGAYDGVPGEPVAATPASSPGGFAWDDAGIGAGATLGLVLILAGIGAFLIRGRRRHPLHA